MAQIDDQNEKNRGYRICLSDCKSVLYDTKLICANPRGFAA